MTAPRSTSQCSSIAAAYRLRQAPLHRSERYGWSTLTGDSIETMESSPGQDRRRSRATMRSIPKRSVCSHSQASISPWCRQACSSSGSSQRASSSGRRRTGSMSYSLRRGGETLIASLQKDFTIMTEWTDRDFDGLLSCPRGFRRRCRRHNPDGRDSSARGREQGVFTQYASRLVTALEPARRH